LVFFDLQQNLLQSQNIEGLFSGTHQSSTPAPLNRKRRSDSFTTRQSPSSHPAATEKHVLHAFLLQKMHLQQRPCAHNNLKLLIKNGFTTVATVFRNR
jgi:hypothetical protein